MSISTAQIDLWRSSASETQNLEFEEAATQYDTRKLCRYCVARHVPRTISAQMRNAQVLLANPLIFIGFLISSQTGAGAGAAARDFTC